MGEDVAAVGLTWFATTHPYVAGVIVAVLLLLIVLFVRFVYRSLKKLFVGAEHELQRAE
jgi:hypothetical protein